MLEELKGGTLYMNMDKGKAKVFIFIRSVVPGKFRRASVIAKKTKQASFMLACFSGSVMRTI